MEKRALLAFVLIIMIWVGYYYIIYPMYVPPPKPEMSGDVNPERPTPPRMVDTETPPVETTVPPQATSDNQITPSTPTSLNNQQGATDRHIQSWDRSEQVILLQSELSDAIPRDIVIESDLYRGIINTRGANVTSWKLKNYRGFDGPFVELIPQDREYGPELIVTSEEGPYSFQDVVFTASQDNLTLTGSKIQGTLVLTGKTRNGLTVSKQYTFTHDNYAFEVKVTFDKGGNLHLGSKYYLRWGGGIRVTEADMTQDLSAFKGFAQLGDTFIEEGDLGTEIDDPRPDTSGDLMWTGVRSKYFLAALIPMDKPGTGYRLNGRPINMAEGMQDRQISAEIAMNLSSPLMDSFIVYLGPVHYETLEQYGFGLENAVDLGWAILRPISKVTLICLVWLHQFISNYGLVIIILSIFVKVLLYPLTHKSLKATQGMQKIQPKMEALKEKYKNDSQKLNQEMMKLYRDGGVNPLGGCLPMVLQMPILFSLYTVFSSTIELRDAPFIDGWIQDLSLKDPIYVLPILMGLTMLLQSKMTMKDPRQAMFIYIMPVVMFFIMKDLPSGLILYWTMVNIITILQQAMQNKFFPTPATT